MVIVDISLLGSNKDVTARKSQEPIAVTSFSKVKGHHSLSFRAGFSRDGKAEGRSQGTKDLIQWSLTQWKLHNKGLEKLRTRRAPVIGFTEVDVDVSDVVVFEKS